MPQAKKHPSVRARTNRASTASTIDGSRQLPASKRPALPQLVDAHGAKVAWHPQTLQWWKDLWAAPMATEYHESDRHALFLLASLMDEFWTATSVKAKRELAGEIRLQRQAFGLTPYDRRRLEWTIEAVDEAQDRGRARRSRPAAAPAASGGQARAKDPRTALHSVS